MSAALAHLAFNHQPLTPIIELSDDNKLNDGQPNR